MTRCDACQSPRRACDIEVETKVYLHESVGRSEMIKVKGLFLSLAVVSGLAGERRRSGHECDAAEGPVVVLLQAEPVSLDPMFTQSDAHTIFTIHEGLFRLDNDGKIVPAIAESITNVDPLTWEVKIRQGLEFHNGEPINADAVVFTFDRAQKALRRQAGRPDLRDGCAAIRQVREDRRLHRSHRDERAGSRSSPRTSSIRNSQSCRRNIIRSTRRRR